ncbi:MAG: hypothetical protein BJG00_009505 [Limnothrix sp. CACIAM 69d]|nr:MAG: hypothetical protein BJG00_009505 [Limnothrix sp. CACIAM 69d]
MIHLSYNFRILEKGQANSLLRGGSWINNPRNCRSANRNRRRADNINNNIGFRVFVWP